MRIRRHRGTSGLGLELGAGDEHYRAFVGPPADYDLVSAMVFNLLTCVGLRQHHRVIDVGCGSLRVGRLLIPYLNPGNYIGVEPNRWLVEDGIANEVGRSQVEIKRPTFVFSDGLEQVTEPLQADFAVAQSVFSHTGLDLVEGWLSQLARHVRSEGALLATFLIGEEDFTDSGWVYPGCVEFRPGTLKALAARYGFGLQVLDWAHPRQTWALFARPDFDASLVGDQPIDWNRVVAKELGP